MNGFKDFGTENSSSQGQNLAVAVLFAPRSLDGSTRPVFWYQVTL
jgi:hypothetical protein